MPSPSEFLMDDFELDIVEAMCRAFRLARRAPQLKNSAEDTADIILAERILELVEEGETDPKRLCSGALRRLMH
jgi:hypothetical protein